jgi:hypothetical protein
MPGAETSEIIFISAMMALILIVCGATVYFFFKTYAKEKRAREAETKKSEIQDPKSKIV